MSKDITDAYNQKIKIKTKVDNSLQLERKPPQKQHLVSKNDASKEKIVHQRRRSPIKDLRFSPGVDLEYNLRGGKYVLNRENQFAKWE
jgi:hypothetical protein